MSKHWPHLKYATFAPLYKEKARETNLRLQSGRPLFSCRSRRHCFFFFFNIFLVFKAFDVTIVFNVITSPSYDSESSEMCSRPDLFFLTTAALQASLPWDENKGIERTSTLNAKQHDHLLHLGRFGRKIL
jgi:hypothetical protein